MKFTIITPTFNAARTLQQTMDSVFAQDYPDFEYIIVDGGSSDGTWSLVREQGESIAVAIQESDEGVYDAINKGILASSGNVINVLGADDYYNAPDVLSRVAEVFENHPLAQIVYGDHILRDHDACRLFQVPDRLGKKNFLLKNPICHQAMFCRRETFDQVGLYDISFKIASDHDWNIKAFGINRLAHVHLPAALCVFRAAGLSSSEISKAEHRLVTRRHFSAIDNSYSYIWDWMRRLRGRVRTRNFSTPISLQR